MRKSSAQIGAGAIAAAAVAFAGAAPAVAQTTMPTAIPGYKLAVFATTPQGYSAPDSIVVNQKHVWIGYGNTAAKDGSGGTSNILEYTLSGQVIRNLTIAGHNDGLRLDPATGMLVALQNEDGNPTIVLIDPHTGFMTAPAPLPPVNGGGYDDAAFIGTDAYVTASNPTLDAGGVNTSPALLHIKKTSTSYDVTPVLFGNAMATNVVTGAPVQLNLTDPDSLIRTPDGALLLDDQGDAQVILIRRDAGTGPHVVQVPLIGGVQIDDTVFASGRSGTLLVSDTKANTVYTISSHHFDIGRPYSAGTGVPATATAPAIPAAVGRLFLDSGAFVPIATGFMAPHGMAFVSGAR